LLAGAVVHPARAVMDIGNRGPCLTAGRFTMRITNIGVIGNAFFNNGLSSDPSFEFPKGSGHELLNHAELWVGALNENGQHLVSGGPLLEWRPTLDPADTVIIRNAGDPGTRPHFDDDGDGRVDEEILNGKDDDGDGKIDEDILLPAQQMLAADYTDDQPEAVNYTYPTGERHIPLGLAVHQEAYAWTLPGHDGIAGLAFTVTNHGSQILRDVRLGLYADLDSRERSQTAGHQDDQLDLVPYAFLFAPHIDTLADYAKQCGEKLSGTVALVQDASPTSTRPGVALVALSHTTDPLAWLVNDAFQGVRALREGARAPRRDSTFRCFAFITDAPPGQGGPPLLDDDRYAAMAGDYPTAPLEPHHDYAVLLSCGPFGHLAPGQSLQFAVALVAITSPESLATSILDTRLLYRGARLNSQPDRRLGDPFVGETGINAHEICLEPPPGVTFNYDPHCPQKFIFDPEMMPLHPTTFPPGLATEVTYSSGHCIWTDLDCDVCTGDDGVDDVRPWETDLRLPPQPATRATPGDHQVLVEWDNQPERAIASLSVGTTDYRFAGYKVYRLDDWRREDVLPEPERWQRLAVFRLDPSQGGLPLAGITDAAVPPDGSGPGGPHYPVGRYRFTDERALDGFDYHYVVTTIMREVLSPAATHPPAEYESPFFASFDDRVVPHATARPGAGQVWVVPNPYRANAEWERQPVAGDVFTRHIDFMGMPRAKATVRIYTLAGDLVAVVDHDGSGGNGEASWNLISRNGQDVESGVYLFTVTSSLGHQVGRFVLIR
jgi:hypothetical protein